MLLNQSWTPPGGPKDPVATICLQAGKIKNPASISAAQAVDNPSCSGPLWLPTDPPVPKPAYSIPSDETSGHGHFKKVYLISPRMKLEDIHDQTF
jgi:hypothetical protein